MLASLLLDRLGSPKRVLLAGLAIRARSELPI